MTENEALKMVEEMVIAKDCELVKTLELKGVLIKALEDVQAYRAIGTPTQIYEKIGGLDVELGKYRATGTIEEFKALKEKNCPKKPVFDYDGYECPNCHTQPYADDVEDKKPMWCDICGQRLDWSKEGGAKCQ